MGLLIAAAAAIAGGLVWGEALIAWLTMKAKAQPATDSTLGEMTRPKNTALIAFILGSFLLITAGACALRYHADESDKQDRTQIVAAAQAWVWNMYNMVPTNTAPDFAHNHVTVTGYTRDKACTSTMTLSYGSDVNPILFTIISDDNEHCTA